MLISNRSGFSLFKRQDGKRTEDSLGFATTAPTGFLNLREGNGMKRVVIFLPGDYRALPNEWAKPQVTETTKQLNFALKKLGRKPHLDQGISDETLRCD